jgi:predicted TIM-barrel fold metal-dependent hydrolase
VFGSFAHMTPAPPIVDHQAHWYPRSYVESLIDRDGYPSARRQGPNLLYESAVGESWLLSPRYTDLDVQLADMDAHGVDVALTSANLPGEVSRLDLEQAVQTLDVLNDELAAAQRRHPDRIVGLCMLPMQDADAALQVLDRAIEQLGLKGVCLLSNIAGRPIVAPDLLRVYRRIEELGVPLFLHPSHTSVAAGAVLSPTIEIGLAWMFDTAAAALALIYGGVLDACPGLTVVHPHLGGALPYVTGRVADCEITGNAEHDLMSYLRTRFFVDCVQSTPGALAFAMEIYGVDRILFATDFPWADRSGSRAYLKNDLDPDAVDRVLYRNRLPQLALPVKGVG